MDQVRFISCFRHLKNVLFFYAYFHRQRKVCEETFYKREIQFLLLWCVPKDVLNVWGDKSSRNQFGLWLKWYEGQHGTRMKVRNNRYFVSIEIVL